MEQSLRLAFVTDIEYGKRKTGAGRTSSKRKTIAYGDRALELVENFVKACDRRKPDCVIDLGDRVANDGAEDDRKNMQDLSTAFNKLNTNFAALVGNHDLVHLTRDDNAHIMHSPAYSHSRDFGDFHIVFFNPEMAMADGQLWLQPAELKWLAQDLAATDKPAIIASHVGLEQAPNGDTVNAPANDDAANNPEGRFYFANADHARTVIAQAGNVVLCMSGHRHANSAISDNGVHYITLQSLVKAKDGYRTRSPYGAHAFVDIHMNNDGTGEINYQLKGDYKRMNMPKILTVPAA